jgi:murein L,D-transpeptidase YafK
MRLIWFMIFAIVQSTPFKQAQLKNVRVKSAYTEKEQTVREYFPEKRLPAGSFNIFMRAFKKEKIVEVWVKYNGSDRFIHLKDYDICATSGVLGPKRKEGDLQVPEGVYQINHFNPQSNFHLSLGINYPNASDKILSDPKHPGGAIYIHGNCVTIGCIPLTDDKIKELYVLAVEARNSGQEKIPVHIFPARLDDAGMQALRSAYSNDPVRISFWENLKTIYEDFEGTKKLKVIKVNSKGGYYL